MNQILNSYYEKLLEDRHYQVPISSRVSVSKEAARFLIGGRWQVMNTKGICYVESAGS